MSINNTPHEIYDPTQHCYGYDCTDEDDTIDLRVITWNGFGFTHSMTVEEWDDLKHSQKATYYCTDCEILADGDIKRWDGYVKKCPQCYERLDDDVRSIVRADDTSAPL